VACTFRNEKEELEYELRLKDEKIKDLEERLAKHENTPKVINKNKNITNNINILTINEVMTPERVEDFFKKHYNLDTLMQGMSGLAKFIFDGFIRDKAIYYCTDRSRHKFIMSDANGENVEDQNCEKLASLTAPGLLHVKDVYETGLFTKHEDISEEEIHDNYKPISNLDKDSTKLSNELSKIVPSTKTPVEKGHKQMTLAEVCEIMRSSQKALLDKKEKDEHTPVSNEELQTIGGYSLGQLLKYRDGYRKRKQEACGAEVQIKGPSSLLELCKTDEGVKKQYEAFVMS
jgi:hypothetical protein